MLRKAAPCIISEVLACARCSEGMNSEARMAPGTSKQDGAGTSIAALPAELLQLFCSFLDDPDDLASCHMVDTRCISML
jgi:hypothetical protein